MRFLYLIGVSSRGCRTTMCFSEFLGLTPPAGCAVWAQIWEREDLIAFATAIMTPCWGCVDVGAMLDPSWAMLGPCWGYVELCRDHVGSCSIKIGALLAHVGAVLGL